MITIKILKSAVTFVAAVFFAGACGQARTNNNPEPMSQTNEPSAQAIPQQSNSNIDTATFGGGCFWCVEAIFQRVDGVLKVESGYSGGTVKNPSYKEVCNGTTGHAEVIRLTYDKTKVSFDDLLQIFWKTHDPTTMNRQGNDIGTQYRSAVFYHNEEQRKTAEEYKKKLNEEKVYPNPIITEITPIKNYYPAEDYHQNYYNQNGSQGYCQYVIQPKIEKFEKVFKDKVKK